MQCLINDTTVVFRKTAEWDNGHTNLLTGEYNCYKVAPPQARVLTANKGLVDLYRVKTLKCESLCNP